MGLNPSSNKNTGMVNFHQQVTPFLPIYFAPSTEFRDKPQRQDHRPIVTYVAYQ